MAFKNGIDTMAGVIDQDYSGEVKVLLINHSSEPYKISAGDRIAQLLIIPIINPEVKGNYNKPKNSRTDNGFGSSGK